MKSKTKKRRDAWSPPQSGIRWITWDARRRKWQIRLSVDGVTICLGHFETVAVAKRVLDEYMTGYLPKKITIETFTASVNHFKKDRS